MQKTITACAKRALVAALAPHVCAACRVPLAWAGVFSGGAPGRALHLRLFPRCVAHAEARARWLQSSCHCTTTSASQHPTRVVDCVVFTFTKGLAWVGTPSVVCFPRGCSPFCRRLHSATAVEPGVRAGSGTLRRRARRRPSAGRPFRGTPAACGSRADGRGALQFVCHTTPFFPAAAFPRVCAAGACVVRQSALACR